MLSVTIHHTHLRYHRRIFERGVLLALAGALVMGFVNFLMGVASQETSPLMAIWFTSVATLVPTIAFLLARGEFRTFFTDLRRNATLIATTCVLDNAAWTFYAFATTLIPIALATTISESYIALAVFLGIFVNKEKLRWHQLVGVAVAVVSVILLSAISL